MQRTKRVISLILSFMLVVSCFTCLASVRAFADDDTNNSATFLYGDVDGDGRVSINDATAVQRHLAEQEGFILEPGTDAFKAADVDGDGEITIDDVTTIQRFLAEFIDHFPAEEVTADTYVVAGTPAEIFGTVWDGSNEANLMTDDGNGKFTKDYTVDKAYTDVQLKTVKNGSEWIGDATGNNVTFNLTGAGTFTVIYDSEENATSVEGEIVEFKTELDYTTVYAVGNGEGFWLNGSAWEPAYAANEMTQVEDDVWEITFENVPDGFERQIKFAVDGAWTHNFGGAFVGSGEETDAVYNGDNITFDTDDDCTVTARLDLSNFDFSTKEGAKFTITIDYGEDETTEAPEETTEAPEETTEAPEETTAAPEETTEAAEPDTYIVAGTPADIFGTAWDGSNDANLMTEQADGTFTKDYTVTKAFDAVQLKTVKNGAEWIGDATGNNVTFNLTGEGTFTVVYDPTENITSVRGDIVAFITDFEYDTVFAVGNGEGWWLNGAAWDPAFAANEMTEVAEDVWEIEFPNVPDGFERQIKFAIDGAWTHNFGGVFEDSGVESEAVYNGDNIAFDTDDICTVKVQLDLRDFDFTAKEGAKFTITITYEGEEEETTAAPEETTEAPEETTEAPEETTEAPEETTAAPEETTEAAEPDTYIVAGTPADIFGTAWDGSNEANLMTEQADGTFTKDYTVTKAFDAVQLKTVKNGAEWIGDATGNNVTFNLTGEGTFTVVYDPTENITSVRGDIVAFITDFEYDTVFAVGNGEGWWLNGAAWDPAFAANEMTEVAEDVWEIEFPNVPDGFERQIKFAIDGAWTHNFGGVFEDSGVESEAVYNGDNIAFDTDDVCTVKVQLDLRDFDFTAKEGAKFTITITYEGEEEETTAAPEETTEAPEETTEAPEETTEAPEETTEAAEPDTYIVAGTPADIFGTAWDGSNEANLMTEQADGTFTKDYTVTKAFDAVQLKTVKNGAEWIGDATGNNVTFNLTGEGTFTVVYDPTENITSVRGDIVAFITDFEYDTVFAVGNGEGWWLNGAAWDPAFAANEMTAVAEDVWEIEFPNVPDGFERQIKFAIDGAWTHNFGGVFEDSGVESEAVYNGDNIAFDTDDVCTVKVQLDLRDFDFTAKEGAKFTITITYEGEEEETTAAPEETTEAPEETTEAPEETTEAPEETTAAPEETTEAAEPDTYIVAGTPADIFGTAWDGSNEANLMTEQADGTFTKDYTVTKAFDAVQLKTVKNGAEWIGDATGNNVTFNLTGEGTFTVVYDPTENITSVRGDIVAFITDFEYDTVFAVGNGEGWWLNGAAWDPAFAANEMTAVAEDVWEIEFPNVPDGFERQIKFAIDGAWTHNFGGVFEDSGVESEAVYNGDNIAFDTDDICTVKVQLDLRDFDFTAKEGAKFTITITYEGEEEETTAAPEETTEAPEETTEAPEETTAAPEETTEAAEPDTYIVAGTPADIFGTAWDGSNEANLMTEQADGTFTKDYTVTKAFDAVQLKTVKNGAEWIGDATGNNVTFNLTGEGTFTVVYDPTENITSVRGDIVAFITDFEYDTVFAVGNGEGWWLNGAAWDPAFAANEMTAVAEDVWEIEFPNVPDGFERQIKFAIDGAWTHNFGGVFEDSGVESEAVYNGDNIAFDTDDVCTVKVQLDLRDFDFTAKEGAKFTITITYEGEEEETTAAPEETTEAPEETTEAPEETTEAPEETTEAPEETTEAAEPDTYIVAGTPADIFGTAWDGSNEANLMTEQADGTFTKDYTVTKAFDAVQLKTVKNGAEWIGDATGNNVTFNLTGEGTFTVVYDPTENITSVRGDIVAFITDFEYDTVFAVGNGEGWWLNGAAWDPAFAANEMTAVAEDVWEIEFPNVPDGFERQIKFAIDGAWTHNFGGVFEDSGVESEAVYNGDNIAFDTDDVCTVKVQLDLRDFDFTAKEGAKFTITITYEDEEEETTAAPEETTEAPEETTEAPEETTEAPEETTEAPEETTAAPEETTEAAEPDTYIVAGTPADIFGTAWDPANEDNLMTEQADGTYTKDYTVAKAFDAVQLKVVKNGAEWLGDSTGNNVTFNLTGAGTFTVAIDSDSNEITVTGDIVEFITDFEYDTVFAVGNGEGWWLNGAAWDPAFTANEMTEIDDNVWYIEYENVPDGFERQIKFAIDGQWTHNFGGAVDPEDFLEDDDNWYDAVYNGDNIAFDTYEDSQTVCITLDLSEFDFASKTGAKFMIQIKYDS